MKYFASRTCWRCLFILSGFLGLLQASGGARAAEPLLWKFVQGGSYHYQLAQEIETTMNLGPGGTTTAAVKQTIDMLWEINSVDDKGTARLTQTIGRVRMNITAPGQGEVHFDTATEEPPKGFAAMLAPALMAMTKSPIKLTMTSRGEVTEVEVPAALLTSMSQGSGGALLGSLATEKGFRDVIAQSLLTLPKAEELVEGHQWSTSLEVENPIAGNILTETTYQYQGPREIEGQPMEVFTPTLVTRFSDERSPGEALLHVKDQETTGEILFNRSAGRLESTAIHQLLDIEVTVGGNSVNQHLDQKIKFQLMNDDGTDE